MKLSWKQTNSYTGWVKYIGKNSNGKPRCFYLGRDKIDAELKAAKLAVAYKRLVKEGHKGWTDEAIAAALAESATKPLPASPAAPDRSGLPTPHSSNLTLHKAIDEYLAYETKRVPGQISQTHLFGVRIRMKRLKRLIPDQPLGDIGYDALADIVAMLAQRPKSEATGEQIGVVTAADMIKGSRTFFDWADASERWIAPRRFEKLFRVKRRSLMTTEERSEANGGVETFTVEELVSIMTAARTKWHRAVIGAALNFAMTQNELATLRRSHIIGLDGENPVVEKLREKTDVFCRWGFVFPPVVDGLRWVLATHAYPLVFAGVNGQPLVIINEKWRRDTVAHWWHRLVRAAAVRPLPFRFLRKTSADMVRKIADKDTSEAMLAHSNEGMSKKYTNHDWEKLAAALRLLYERFKPIFEVPEAPMLVPRMRKARLIPTLARRPKDISNSEIV